MRAGFVIKVQIFNKAHHRLIFDLDKDLSFRRLLNNYCLHLLKLFLISGSEFIF